MIGIYNATTDNISNHFIVCPNYVNGACSCPKDSAGNPVPAHPAYTYPAASPDSRTAQQWAQACATEAKRLVAAQQTTATSTALTGIS